MVPIHKTESYPIAICILMMFGMAFAMSLPETNSSARAVDNDASTSTPTRSLSVKITLQADPTIKNEAYQTYVLDNSKKIFIAEFSAPMDAASAERAFFRRNKDHDEINSSTVTFQWPSPGKCLVQLESLKKKCGVSIGFAGARSQDGTAKLPAFEDSDSLPAEQQKLGFEIFPERQFLKKIDLKGNILASYTVDNEPLFISDVFGGGRYALAYRFIHGDEWNYNVPCLLELSGSRAVRYWLDRRLDITRSVFIDPMTGGLIQEKDGKFIAHDVESIKAGKPGRLLFDLRLNDNDYRPELNTQISSNGRKIAIVWPSPAKDDLSPTLTLVIMDRMGNTMNKMKLPAHALLHEGVFLSVGISWQDEEQLLVAITREHRSLSERDNGPDSTLYRVNPANGRMEKPAENVIASHSTGNFIFVSNWNLTSNSYRDFFKVLDKTTGQVIVDRVDIRLNSVHQLNEQDFLIGASRLHGKDPDANEVYEVDLFHLPSRSLKKIADGKLVGMAPDAMWVVNEPSF